MLKYRKKGINMSVKKVVKYGTPSLRQPSKEVYKVSYNDS